MNISNGTLISFSNFDGLSVHRFAIHYAYDADGLPTVVSDGASAVSNGWDAATGGLVKTRGAERVRSTAFVPAAFDVSDTQTVHRLSFTPKYPQTHNVVVRYPWTDDGWGKPDDSHGASVRLGGDGKFYRHYPVSAALTVRHRGSPAMELPVREAKLWCAYSGGGHELMLGRLDVTRFSWWYGDPIEVEVRLLKPIEGIPFVRGTNGTLVVYSQMPFE